MGGSIDHLGTTFSLINYTGPDSKFINLTAIPEPASLLAVAGLLVRPGAAHAQAGMKRVSR
jgi:hypothetical protein